MQLASTRLATQLSQANSEYERELVAKERGSLNQHHAWLRMQVCMHLLAVGSPRPLSIHAHVQVHMHAY
jgi:hypothetical protein